MKGERIQVTISVLNWETMFQNREQPQVNVPLDEANFLVRRIDAGDGPTARKLASSLLTMKDMPEDSWEVGAEANSVVMRVPLGTDGVGHKDIAMAQFLNRRLESLMFE